MRERLTRTFQRIALCCLISLPAFSLFGQESADRIFWSETRKLTVDDFVIQIAEAEGALSFAQFGIDYSVRGFNMFEKNQNKRVTNSMIRSASWIDPSGDVTQALLYQQTLWDIAEIYARQLRKAIQEHRKEIFLGTCLIDQLNDQVMSDFSRRRLKYTNETQWASKPEAQAEWELHIQTELQELAAYAYDYAKKK